MITADLLKQQEKLAHLTDEDRALIASISEIDETKVIGNKLAETWKKLDETIEAVSGLTKNREEKSYDFAARAVKESKAGGGDDLKKELETLKADKLELEKQIKNGNGDAALKKQVADLEKELQDKKSLLKQTKDKYDADIAARDADIEKAQKDSLSVRIDYQFEQALSAIKFKDDKTIPKEVRDAFVEKAKQAVLSEFTPDFVDDGKGGKQLVFRKGQEIQRNPENGLQIVTAQELLTKHLTPVIDAGRQATGSGQKPGGPGYGAVNPNGTFRIDARSQVEADEQIGKYLTDSGVARGTEEFSDKLKTIREENKVAELPFKQ